jgi:hypothetical protein
MRGACMRVNAAPDLRKTQPASSSLSLSTLCVSPPSPPSRPRPLAEAQRNEPEEIQKLIDGGMDPSVANGVGQTGVSVAKFRSRCRCRSSFRACESVRGH